MKRWMLIQITAFIVLFLLVVTAVFAQIPKEAERWKRQLTQQARLSWGLDAPIATLASQIQQESSFNPDARSPAGALGLAQFMPATGAWLSGAYSSLGPSDPLNPVWALRAHATYTKYLWDRTSAAKECDHGAKMLASYNSGEGWLHKDENMCRAKACAVQPPVHEEAGVTAALRWVWERSFGKASPEPVVHCGCDEAVWFGNVELMKSPGRSEANWNESRNYARRILRVLEPRYVTAGWGRGVCSAT